MANHCCGFIADASRVDSGSVHVGLVGQPGFVEKTFADSWARARYAVLDSRSVGFVPASAWQYYRVWRRLQAGAGCAKVICENVYF